MVGRGLRAKTETRRGEKDESLKGLAPDWPATWTISYPGANDSAIGAEGGTGGSAMSLLCSNYTSR